MHPRNFSYQDSLKENIHPIVLSKIFCPPFDVVSKAFQIRCLLSHLVDRLGDDKIQGKVL